MLTQIDATDELLIHLHSWIIQDGNYGEFESGNNYSFALEFWTRKGFESRRADKAAINGLKLQSKKQGEYEAIGEVIYLDDKWIVFDFGVRAYIQRFYFPSARMAEKYITSLFFGVDPFFYFEDFSQRTNAPEMIYDWRLEKIFKETGPFIKPDGLLQRDLKRLGLHQIAQTNAWNDDDGRASYVFECALINSNPKQSF